MVFFGEYPFNANDDTKQVRLMKSHKQGKTICIKKTMNQIMKIKGLDFTMERITQKSLGAKLT